MDPTQARKIVRRFGFFGYLLVGVAMLAKSQSPKRRWIACGLVALLAVVALFGRFRVNKPAYTLIDLGVPDGFTDPFPYDVNNQGQVIVMAARVSDHAVHTFVWQQGAFRDIGT